IAYSALGSGTAVVFVSDATGVLSGYATTGNVPQRMVDGVVASGHRVVMYDRRGAGFSDRTGTDQSLKARHIDLEAVVARAGLERFALISWDAATPAAVTFAAQCPEHVSRLILCVPWVSFERRLALNPRARIQASLEVS